MCLLLYRENAELAIPQKENAMLLSNDTNSPCSLCFHRLVLAGEFLLVSSRSRRKNR
jgi:hypothetical protein